jgi:integrase/recombinase XerD
VTETCGLYLRDIDFREGELHIRPEISKGRKEAHLYLGDSTVQLLELWKPARRKLAGGKPWLFVTHGGAPVRRGYVYEMVSRYARKAGIEKKVGPHILRHTHATELLREGFDLRQIQKLMRHSDIRSTVLYTNCSTRS